VCHSTRTCTAPTNYTPSFTGTSYETSLAKVLHLSFLTHEAFESPLDSQVIATITTQLSLKAGLKPSGQMMVSHGKSHKYIGMTLDYTTSGQVKVMMFDYIKEILAAFDAVDPKATSTKASAAPDELFKVNEKCEKLGPKLATAFHTLVAQTLYTTKCAHSDTCTAIAFLTTRVREPDLDDWAKLTHLMKY